MTHSEHDLRCVHCGAAVSEADLADTWCGECGKKLPSFLRDAIKPEASRAPVRITDDGSMGRQRLLAGGVIVALVGLLALAFIPNLF